MVATLTFGFKPESLLPDQGTVWSFPIAPRRDDLDDLVDLVRLGQERHGHVVAIYPAWRPEPALRRLETVQAATDSRRLAVYGTALPPLAGAVLASLTSAVSAYVPSAGTLVSGLGALERELITMAWLGGVTGLSSPSPSILQHVASWWPKSSFGVFFWPQPSVKLLTKKERAAVPVPTTYRPQCVVIAAREGADRTWVDECVLPAFGSPPTKEVEATELGPEWWGTSRLTELVAYPVDVPVTARRISQGLVNSLCRWCGEPVASDRCPFCGIDLSSVARTPEGAV
jgi:hypothetical protein